MNNILSPLSFQDANDVDVQRYRPQNGDFLFISIPDHVDAWAVQDLGVFLSNHLPAGVGFVLVTKEIEIKVVRRDTDEQSVGS